MGREKRRCSIFCLHRSPGCAILKAVPHNSRLTAQAPFRRLRHGICVAKMLNKTSSIICAFGLAVAAPSSPYRHLELCGIASDKTAKAQSCRLSEPCRFGLLGYKIEFFNTCTNQAKNEMTSATRNPTPPTKVSIMVQVLRVVFSSMPTRLLTSQKPESLK